MTTIKVRAFSKTEDKPAGFFGASLRYNGNEFTLEDVYKTDVNGKAVLDGDDKPIIVKTAEQQFSKKWMIKVEDDKKSFKKSK